MLNRHLNTEREPVKKCGKWVNACLVFSIVMMVVMMVVTRFTDHRRRVHSAGPRIDNAAPASTVYTHVKSVAVMLG